MSSGHCSVPLARLTPVQEVAGSIPAFSNIFFAIFFKIGNYFTNQQNIIKFVLGMSELVENDTSLAYIGQFLSWRQFLAKNAKNRTRGS